MLGAVSGANHRLYSRALILDGALNPTTITVLSNEYLTVYYQQRIQMPLTDASGSVTISGVGTFNYTRRTQNIQNTTGRNNVIAPASTQFQGFNNWFTCAAGALAAITAGPASQLGSTSGGLSLSTYVLDTYERSQTGTFPLSPQLNNILTIGSNTTVGSDLYYQLDAPFTKLSTQILTITLKVNWARA
jgi:hypothetical protein